MEPIDYRCEGYTAKEGLAELFIAGSHPVPPLGARKEIFGQPAMSIADKRRGGKKYPCQQRSRAMVSAIVEAAACVIASKGFEAATTNEIAERAGASVGSLYQYFPNKLALLYAVNERFEIGVFSQAAAACRDGCRLPWPSAVRNLIEAVTEYVAHNRALLHVILRELPMEAMHAPESILKEEFATAKAKHDGDLRNLLTQHSAHITVGIDEAVYMVPVIGKGAFAAILTTNPEYLLNGKLADMLTELQLKYLTSPQRADSNPNAAPSAEQNLK